MAEFAEIFWQIVLPTLTIVGGFLTIVLCVLAAGAWMGL